MPTLTQTPLEPRKTPVQARSTASVEAILEATIQVLLDTGKQRLTTTRVAHRAGVSVGTLYQYFPNKSSLLQATLRRHLTGVANAVERVCELQRGQPLRTMVTALINAFLEAKMQNPKTSIALYAVSSDVDGLRIGLEMRARYDQAVIAMLTSSCQPLTTDPLLVATMLRSILVGVSRSMLESHATLAEYHAIRQQLILAGCAYIDASSSTSDPKPPAPR